MKQDYHYIDVFTTIYKVVESRLHMILNLFYIIGSQCSYVPFMND